jgi:hypothetical protein
MHAVAKSSIAAFALLLITACGGAPAPDAATAAEDKAAAEAVGRDTDATVVDDMIQTEDRARAVENLTLGRKDDLDQALEASESDGAAKDE